MNVPHSALTPVFTGLRFGLHAAVAVLTLLVGVRAVVGSESPVLGVLLTVLFALVYACGGMVARRGTRWGVVWLGALVAVWLGLLLVVAEAAYLVFPLFFLFLHLLRPVWGITAVVASTAVTVAAIGLRDGWTIGGVVGPFLGAGVALLIGWGYDALARESAQREALLRELLTTQNLLAATEHEAGVLAERSRLAREIHDTVAQGLSSIQMLLHAAERADPQRPGVEHVRLARETAATSLAETRRFIRELTPPPLDERGLAGAVERLAQTQWRPAGLEVKVRIGDTARLPMHLQTALLRIIQGAMANVVQHAQARTAVVSLTHQGGQLVLEIRDDGRGFDPAGVKEAAFRQDSDSFGLRATRERVAALQGELAVESAAGQGTTVRVTVDVS